ncbi:hypothetical protein B9Z55_009039 [Caenorhabditis nigoni]|nr:hypothetical protein B9Z55_009039 [Caenorhabditis nigoni]
MKNIIKSSQTKRFNSIPRIVYVYDRIQEGRVYIPTKPRIRYINGRTRTARMAELIIETVERQEDAKHDYFQLNVAGKLIDFEIRKDFFQDYCPVASFLSIDKESVMESIHNYFLDFIGDSVDYHWIAEDCKLSISQLQNLSTCLSVLHIDNGLDDMKNLEAIFSSSPALKQIENGVKPLEEPFSPESKFSQAESLKLKLNEKTLLAVLQHFQGRQACLKCSSSFEIRALTNFVNRWKSGEAFQKLEYLKVELPFGTEFEGIPEILNSIGVKQIDETQTPLEHCLHRVCIPLSYGSRCPTRFPMIAFNQCDKQSIFESIHNYLLDFFGDTIEYEWIITDFQFFVPRVQHLSLVLNFRNTGTDEENIERLENIISLSPIMKHVQTTYWRPPGTLKPESKLYQAESISIVQDVPTILVNLGCFQGKQASFRCHSCRIFDLIEFVNRWKSGEAFQNLEHLEIILNHTDFPLNGVLNAIGVKYIDLVKTPPTHTLPKVYFESGHKPNTDPINSHTYVEKETDNRVASMSIEGTTFSFGVWNKTEEEFLALVK